MLSERPAVIANARMVLHCERMPLPLVRSILPDLPETDAMPAFRTYILAGGSKLMDELLPVLLRALTEAGISDAITVVPPP